MSILDSQTIKIPCPHCRRQRSETVAKLRLNPNLTCQSCGANFKIDATDLSRAAKEIDKQLADMKRSLGRLR